MIPFYHRMTASSDVLTLVAQTSRMQLPLLAALACLAVVAVCPAQTPNWQEIKPTFKPPKRHRHALAYDAHRQRTVLFGGDAFPTGSLGDTWEWDGTNWTQLKPTTSPVARHDHAMVYDFVRQRTLLFGGLDTARRFLRDTWEWDGKNWTHLKPTTSPSARSDHGMVYDTVRQRVVLFGGANDSKETWEWDGKNWTLRKPTNSPRGRERHAMAYDSTRRRTVLFGGEYGSQLGLADTWEWDGTNWTQIKPTTSPSVRSKHEMVFDVARQRVVLHGGVVWTGNGMRHGDTWEWDGKNWTEIKTAVAAIPRYRHKLAYDSARQRTVLFGGDIDREHINQDTWEYGLPKLTFTANTPTISIANGGTQTLSLNAGAALGNKTYWIFGSATATVPGVAASGIQIPLVIDAYTHIVISDTILNNSTIFTKFRGTLSATGTATAPLIVPSGLGIPKGMKLFHCFVVYDANRMFTASNALSVEFK